MDPKQLGGYELQGVLGEGGMGKVYRGFDRTLDRPVAIKVVHSKLLGDEGKQRFLREARACSKITHPNIITVYGAGEEDGTPYMAMEYIDGRELRKVINEGEIDWRQALRWTIDILDALSHLHAEGIVHRDLKPENIMVTNEGVIKLMDFGLAHLTQQTALTAEGTTLGTAPYMSPEQVMGQKADSRSDLFSIATMLQEMATGEHPFQGEHPMAVMFAIKTEPPRPLGTGSQELPAGFQEVLDRAFQKSPDDRFQTAGEFRDALMALLPENAGAGAAPAATSVRTIVIAAVAAVAILAVGIGAWKVIEGRRAAGNRTLAVNYNEKGMLKLGQGDLDGAEADLRNAVQADEDYHVSWHNLGLLALERGDSVEADSLFRRAARLDPHYAPPRYQLGVMHHDHGELDAAAKYYREAITADPEFLAAYNNLGAVLMTQGHYEQARAILDSGLSHAYNRKTRDVYARMLDKRGRVDEALGDSTSAQTFFDRAKQMKDQP